ARYASVVRTRRASDLGTFEAGPVPVTPGPRKSRSNHCESRKKVPFPVTTGEGLTDRPRGRKNMGRTARAFWVCSPGQGEIREVEDQKSRRLNSSHVSI